MLNVELVFVPPGTLVKLLFRAVVVAASRLYKSMKVIYLSSEFH